MAKREVRRRSQPTTAPAPEHRQPDRTEVGEPVRDAGGWTRPQPGDTYPLALRPLGGDPRDPMLTMRGLVMVLVIVIAYQVIVPLVNLAVVALGWLANSGADWADYYARAGQFASPIGIWGAHLGLTALIAAAWAVYRFQHRRRLAWLWSVMPGVRWRYGLACLLVALVVFGTMAAWQWSSTPGWQPPAGWGWFLLAILITSPFQALAEEVIFRGYLIQGLGLVVRQTWFPIVGSALLFGFFHGTQNLPLFIGRCVFGLLAGVLVWRTGGIEAGVIAHTCNNLAAFGLALFSGQLVEARTITEVPWLDSLRDCGLFLVFAAAAWGIAHLMKVPWRAPIAE